MSESTYNDDGTAFDLDEEVDGEVEDEGMSEAEVEQSLHLALEKDGTFATIHNFEDSGVWTRNRGLVVTTDEDDEFQITIIRSR